MFLITFAEEGSGVTTVCQRADNVVDAALRLIASRPWITPEMLVSVEFLDINSAVDRQQIERVNKGVS